MQPDDRTSTGTFPPDEPLPSPIRLLTPGTAIAERYEIRRPLGRLQRARRMLREQRMTFRYSLRLYGPRRRLQMLQMKFASWEWVSAVIRVSILLISGMTERRSAGVSPAGPPASGRHDDVDSSNKAAAR